MAARVVSWPCLFLLSFLIPYVSTLQVAPESPCSSFCLDESDPETWITRPEDITCDDEDFDSESEGKKFQRCLSCLQDSDYSKDDETDQQWFIYNLRYAFDYCVLGYPNATDVESSPCSTEESCGHLEVALKDQLLDPDASQPYDFCKEDREVILSEYHEICTQCIRAGNSQRYLSNFMVAIRAGCEQQPEPGVVVGLNDTVFTSYSIEVINPSTSDDDSDNLALSPPIIAAIAISGLVAILIVAACTYMQIRKRKNREARLRRTSPLSFRCQTHVTPKTPNFPREGEEVEKETTEKKYIDPSAALMSNPVAPRGGPAKLTNLITTSPIPQPRPIHSPRSGFPSPPENHYTTPTSTTSTNSNAPLLASSHKPYQPSDFHSSSSYHHGTGSGLPGLAISTLNTTSDSNQQSASTQRPFSYDSDQFSIHQARQETIWEQPPSVNPARDLMYKRGSPRIGGPVASSHIQTSFPPPPNSSKK